MFRVEVKVEVVWTEKVVVKVKRTRRSRSGVEVYLLFL
jgi:hypothetical protein